MLLTSSPASRLCSEPCQSRGTCSCWEGVRNRHIRYCPEVCVYVHRLAGCGFFRKDDCLSSNDSGCADLDCTSQAVPTLIADRQAVLMDGIRRETLPADCYRGVGCLEHPKVTWGLRMCDLRLRNFRICSLRMHDFGPTTMIDARVHSNSESSSSTADPNIFMVK